MLRAGLTHTAGLTGRAATIGVGLSAVERAVKAGGSNTTSAVTHPAHAVGVTATQPPD